jgi:hypothetical protein
VATAQTGLGGSCRVSLVGAGLSISPMASTPIERCCGCHSSLASSSTAPMNLMIDCSEDAVRAHAKSDVLNWPAGFVYAALRWRAQPWHEGGEAGDGGRRGHADYDGSGGEGSCGALRRLSRCRQKRPPQPKPRAPAAPPRPARRLSDVLNPESNVTVLNELGFPIFLDLDTGVRKPWNHPDSHLGVREPVDIQ